MFDIDKVLQEVKPEPQHLSNRLRESTRQLVDQEVRKKQGTKQTGKLSWLLPVAAAMLAAFMFLFTLPPAAAEVSYITIDINPSISMQVSASGTVICVSSENDDATKLLKDMSLTGLHFVKALKAVVQAADDQGYLKDDGHVLVARFGAAIGMTQQQIESAVAESTQHEVKVLLLQSSKETFERAKAGHEKPGVALLKEQALMQGIKEQDVDEIMVQMGASEKANAQNSSHQGQKVESGDGVAPNNQSQKDNAADKNENGQNQQSSDSENGKGVKEGSDASASQDKPTGGNNGKQGNNNSQGNNDNQGGEANQKKQDSSSQNSSSARNEDKKEK